MEKERIEKDAIQYEDKNPYDAIHSAYYMGAITEHRKNAQVLDSLKKMISIAEAHKGEMTPEKMIIIYESESAIERAKSLIANKETSN